MNLEEQLRDAFVAAAETVRPETIRDCPPPSGPGRLRRWSRSVPVVAAAASVVAIVVGGSVAASLLSSGSHGRQAASRYRASSGPVSGPVPAAGAGSGDDFANALHRLGRYGVAVGIEQFALCRRERRRQPVGQRSRSVAQLTLQRNSSSSASSARLDCFSCGGWWRRRLAIAHL